MAANSGIAWTDHTFNPWWGCSKVSAGCANCYAEGVAGRFATENLWGKGAERKPASEKVWNDPLRWNRSAEKAGRRDLVFCASMADVFEDRRDLDAHRERLWGLIRVTPNLRWLLLSKRPENFRLIPPEVAALVALGVSVENQEAADRRIPLLLQAPAAIRFLSVEPMLGPVDAAFAMPWRTTQDGLLNRTIDWVICGGESGGIDSRPMHPDWARSLRDQCQGAGVPFFFKQWGKWLPCGMVEDEMARIRQTMPDGPIMCYARELIEGHTLDGREWLEFPAFLRAPAEGGAE